MFYDRFKELCDLKGVSCNKAALEIGLSNATATKWKKTGATPSGDTLEKVAAYFGVSTDYLLEKPERPSMMDLFTGKRGYFYEKEQPTETDGLFLEGVSEEDIKTIKAYLEMPEDQRRALAKILGVSE